jgi:formylglycine-generating enzyme required for sulfatase activity
MRRLVTLFLVTLFILALPSVALCYDIKATNPSVGTLSGGSTAVTFDITWKKSWRNANVIGNWDAAWVFVKFRTTTGGTIGDWKHASLNNSGHSVPSGATLTTGLVDTSSSFNIATNPVVGVFIYRSSDGAGTFTANNVALSWNYSQDGVSNSDTVEIRVFGIEMVYIPQGGFFAGDNATSYASFKQGSNDNDPWWIGSEDAITVSNSAGTGTGLAEKAAEYYYVTDGSVNDDATGAAFTIPAAFPKGYQAFYMMKGEVAQGQWIAFFNTLTATQKSTRDITSTGDGKSTDNLTNRNNVSWTSGDATLPDRGGGANYAGVAIGFIKWADLTAYLDWAGLRPMSELEYERAARGPYRPVSGEYSWGSTSIAAATSITNAGLPTEGPGSAANCVVNQATSGPMRVGSMAYGDTTRIEGGIGHFGNVDLSGNVFERCITVGNSGGRSFEGRYHGNGTLDASGNQNVNTWPAMTGYRGSSYAFPTSLARLSDRAYAAETDYGARFSDDGGRGVRVAP